MKSTKKTITEYTITEWEADVIIKCLTYCRHRFANHPNSGLHKGKVRVNAVVKILEDFNGIMLKEFDEEIDKILPESFELPPNWGKVNGFKF